MIKKYSAELHEEAIMEDKRYDEESYCPICGIYDTDLLFEKVAHECSPRILKKLEEKEKQNKPRISTPQPIVVREF